MCVCACGCVRVYECECVSECVHTCECVRARAQACVFVRSHESMCMRARVHVCVCARARVPGAGVRARVSGLTKATHSTADPLPVKFNGTVAACS